MSEQADKTSDGAKDGDGFEQLQQVLTGQAEAAERWSELAERSQRVVQAFWEHQSEQGFQVTDPVSVGKAFLEMSAALWSDPAKMMEAQSKLMQENIALWQSTNRRMLGEEVDPVIEPSGGDRRFKANEWSEDLLFDFIKQSYLLSSRWAQSLVRDVEGIDPKSKEKVDFYTRQYLSALSPTNFAMTNPAVLKKTMDTGGENLMSGLQNLISDLEKGDGRLAISMTDESKFEVGKNVAVTPGKVVFQNDLMQLIQYAPSTENVYKRPLLFVPPWINKFYVLDLQPKNSLIKWAVDQGYTLFVISWVNPRKELAHKSFSDYMLEGPLAAIDAIEQATGESKINVLGFCIGGILTVSTLAYMAEKGDDRVASATLLATMVDLQDIGEVSVFIDDEQLAAMDRHMEETGYLEAHHLAQIFNMMRENDLIWSFVVNNYLLGRDAMPFDLLYWNSDSTRLPASMLSYYLRKVYQENLLKEPGGMVLDDTPIDISKIKIPTYFLATKEDHIAPWGSSYPATSLLGGPVRFVLGASGHIAGIVNPPAANKYCHWTNSKKPKSKEDWFEGAERHEGSWWPDWHAWLSKKSGSKKTPPRIPGDGKLPIIEDAPGSYVKVRAND